MTLFVSSPSLSFCSTFPLSSLCYEHLLISIIACASRFVCCLCRFSFCFRCLLSTPHSRPRCERPLRANENFINVINIFIVERFACLPAATPLLHHSCIWRSNNLIMTFVDLPSPSLSLCMGVCVCACCLSVCVWVCIFFLFPRFVFSCFCCMFYIFHGLIIAHFTCSCLLFVLSLSPSFSACWCYCCSSFSHFSLCGCCCCC